MIHESKTAMTMLVFDSLVIITAVIEGKSFFDIFRQTKGALGKGKKYPTEPPEQDNPFGRFSFEPLFEKEQFSKPTNS
jgi:hypothetical protein